MPRHVRSTWRKPVTTIILDTIPSHHERTPGGTHTVIVYQIGGERLSQRISVAVKTLDDIRAAVQAYGNQVAAVHPDKSFVVVITMAKGCRKPKGFDAADDRNDLCQQMWMKTVTVEPYSPDRSATIAA
jgi:hypothetical protein